MKIVKSEPCFPLKIGLSCMGAECSKTFLLQQTKCKQHRFFTVVTCLKPVIDRQDVTALPLLSYDWRILNLGTTHFPTTPALVDSNTHVSLHRILIT